MVGLQFKGEETRELCYARELIKICIRLGDIEHRAAKGSGQYF